MIRVFCFSLMVGAYLNMSEILASDEGSSWERQIPEAMRASGEIAVKLQREGLSSSTKAFIVYVNVTSGPAPVEVRLAKIADLGNELDLINVWSVLDVPVDELGPEDLNSILTWSVNLAPWGGWDIEGDSLGLSFHMPANSSGEELVDMINAVASIRGDMEEFLAK